MEKIWVKSDEGTYYVKGDYDGDYKLPDWVFEKVEEERIELCFDSNNGVVKKGGASLSISEVELCEGILNVDLELANKFLNGDMLKEEKHPTVQDFEDELAKSEPINFNVNMGDDLEKLSKHKDVWTSENIFTKDQMIEKVNEWAYEPEVRSLLRDAMCGCNHLCNSFKQFINKK